MLFNKLLNIFFSYSGPSGMLGSKGKQNTAWAGAGGYASCYEFPTN